MGEQKTPGYGQSGLNWPAVAGEKPTRQRVVVILILLVTLLVAYLDRVNISVLVADDTFLQEMGIQGDALAMGSLMSIFLFTYAITNALLSPLGDLWGPRKVMSVAIILWMISCVYGGIVSSFTGMVVARCILGLGEGMHWPMQMKYVKNWFPPQERARANSTWLIGLTAGPALAMPFMVWIIGEWGWRSSFFALAALGLIPLVLIWFFTTDSPRESKRINHLELEHIEYGLRTEAEALATRAVADSNSDRENWKGFLLNFDYWLCVVFYVFSTSAWWGLATWIPSYLKQAMGFSWKSMGFWANAPYAAGIVALIIAGYVTDKIERKATFGILHMLGAAVGIYFAAHATGQVEAALWLILAVSSLLIGQPGHWAIIQKVVPAKALGAGSGFESCLGSLGGAITPMIVGYFINVTGSYMGGLMCLVVFCLIGAVAMITLWVRKV
ncbi:MFS transporter [Sporomusa sp.]|jgi:sugar phosphate permease|uniref:MFS transporter n=1 Tax=Sporomusa sp. TaxID=2078658 RepID=UPI002D1A846B|nr:MFS transporter [Sporomusa sp.]MDF2874461.1 sauU 5 [Sporomusa sp.]HWR07660.1 MFS transporter [Sporomusa sp.]